MRLLLSIIGLLLASLPVGGSVAWGQEATFDEVAGTLLGRPVAVSASGERLVVVLDQGEVQVALAGGTDWRRVLARLPGAEDPTRDRLLEVEGMLSDLESIEEDLDSDRFEADEEDADPVDDLGSDVGDAASDYGTLLEEELRDLKPDRQAVPVRAVWGRGERLAVLRADGVRVSEDAGRSWQVLSREPARAAADGPGGWVVALASGQVLVAGRAERLDMGPFRAQVLDVAIADGTVWAATDLGLWRRTEDGWRSAGERDEPMTRVVADPGWEGGLWVRTASGVARTDDGGTSWRDLDGGPRVQNDLAWGGPAPGGALLVTSPSGTWDWREEGWTRLDPTPGRSVSWWDGRPIVATGDRLLGRSADAELISAGPPPWVPLGQLLHTALSRRELTQSMSARRWVRTLLPEVTLDGTYRERSERELDLYTTARTHGELSLKVQLRWIPAGRTTSMVSEAAEDLSLRLPEFADRVFDGLLDAGEAADREATEYRGELTRDIVALYRARNTLWLERAAVPPDSLLAEVRWQLRLDDIEARLDALTDGAVSAWDENVE